LNDRYDSVFIGKRSKPKLLGNNETIIGIFGTAGADLNRLGAIMKD